MPIFSHPLHYNRIPRGKFAHIMFFIQSFRILKREWLVLQISFVFVHFKGFSIIRLFMVFLSYMIHPGMSFKKFVFIKRSGNGTRTKVKYTNDGEKLDQDERRPKGN